MRTGLRVEVKKNKAMGTYFVEAHFGNDVFVCVVIDKDDAIRCRDNAKTLLDRIKVSKLKATLTDVEINSLSYHKVPMADKGIFEDMLRDLLRNNFVKTAKYVRDYLLEVNLNAIKDEEEIE